MRRLLIASLAALSLLGLTATSALATADFDGALLWHDVRVVTVGSKRTDVQAPTCRGTFTARLTLGDHHRNGECLDSRWYGATSWPGLGTEIHARLTDEAGTVSLQGYRIFGFEDQAECQRIVATHLHDVFCQQSGRLVRVS
jgi:hypothetical protein